MSNLASNIWATYKSYMKTGLLAMAISAILFAFFGLLIWMGNYQIPENIGRQIVKVCSILLVVLVTMETIYIKTGWPKQFQGTPRKFTFSYFLNLVIAATFIYSVFFSGK